MMNAKTLSLSATVWLLAAILIGVPGPWTGTASAGSCDTLDPAAADYLTRDTDLDGIPDYYECNGFPFYSGGQSFPGFGQRGSLSRSAYLDPDSKDLFLVVSRATGSLIPDSGNTTNDILFQDIVEPTGSGGLGTTIHYLADCTQLADTSCLMSRQLSSFFGQWAARVAEENTASTGNILGFTPVGPPTILSVSATLYTLRTKNFTLKTVCDNTNFCDGKTCYTNTSYATTPVPFTCYDYGTGLGRTVNSNVIKSSLGTDASNATLTPLIDLYQGQNAEHETGHMMNLIQNTNATTTPPHYASSQTGSIMESSVYYKRNYTTASKKITKVDVIWYMPGSFNSTDVTNMKLK